MKKMTLVLMTAIGLLTACKKTLIVREISHPNHPTKIIEKYGSFEIGDTVTWKDTWGNPFLGEETGEWIHEGVIIRIHK